MSNHRNVAYDLSLFDVKEKNNVIDLPDERERKIKKTRAKAVTFAICSVVLGLFVTSKVICGQIELMELSDSINSVSKELTESESIHTQLKMKLESQLSLKSVEKYATENLNMNKVSPYQIKYLNFSEKDKAEIDPENNNEKILGKLRNIFSNLE